MALSVMENVPQRNSRSEEPKQLGQLIEEKDIVGKMMSGSSFSAQKHEKQKLEKKLRKEQTLAVADTALKKLCNELGKGQSESLKTFLQVMSRFHRYSFRNQLLISAQRPDASRVAGYDTWKKLGRQVRKGEKGIRILAPVVKKVKNDGAVETEKRIVGFRVASVFDITQTDGDALPDLARIEGDPGTNLLLLRKLVRKQGIELTMESLHGPHGISNGGSISIERSLDAVNQFGVLAHELAHEMLHKSDRRKDTTKMLRETEAEAVAFVVCDAFGIETTLRSTDYIQLYGGGTEVLAGSLSHVRKTAAAIIDGVRRLRSW